jgi:hypothetical protein
MHPLSRASCVKSSNASKKNCFNYSRQHKKPRHLESASVMVMATLTLIFEIKSTGLCCFEINQLLKAKRRLILSEASVSIQKSEEK